MATILGRGTVLFVDENNSRASTLRAAVSSAGYNCTIENSARSALRRVKTRSVNVIVASSELTDRSTVSNSRKPRTVQADRGSLST